MADDTKLAEAAYPLEPLITLEMSEQPEHDTFTRYLTFQNHDGEYRRLAVAFHKTGPLRWEVEAFPNGIDTLRSLAEPGNRNYWDRMYLESRGGTTTLPIERLKIVMCYANPSGDSPDGIDHGKIPVVDWPVRQTLATGDHMIGLSTYALYSRFAWAGVSESDPQVVRMAAEDLGKSGSDGKGQDHYGNNPKYGAGLENLCSEFVSWYYCQAGIKVNGKSVRDIIATQQLHDLFKAEGTLYRYNSGTHLQAFVHATSGARYIPKSGDFLERRKDYKAEHSMLMLRWLPGEPGAANVHHRYNRAIVINGPWPVTLRLVRIHEEEVDEGKDYWLGRID
jgi:hypothetical protein